MQRDIQFEEDGDRLLAFTVEIVTAHIANNSVGMGDVPGFIANVHATLSGLNGAPAEEETEEPGFSSPIMDPKKAVKPDSITCLICGKKGTVLTQHLKMLHGLTADQYRAQFDLPSNYPIATKAYIANCRERALGHGFGRGESRKVVPHKRPAAAQA